MLKTQSNMLAFAVMLTATPASANVVTDWDATGVGLVQGNAPFPPPRVGGAYETSWDAPAVNSRSL